jgi:hypothetical protein
MYLMFNFNLIDWYLNIKIVFFCLTVFWLFKSDDWSNYKYTLSTSDIWYDILPDIYYNRGIPYSDIYIYDDIWKASYDKIFDLNTWR